MVLYFAQLAEEYRLLRRKERRLQHEGPSPGTGKGSGQLQALAKEKHALLLNTLVNAAYFPLTIHWSLASSSFPDVGVGLCGTVAALVQFYTTWQAA